ncbi:MAG TPA: hypothetical protein VK807_23455 [Gemmatimonadaceae bacterium]|jgi:hypothetical protein|nr:hypothetical protein [Gemmatimonadaceae bacterium]
MSILPVYLWSYPAHLRYGTNAGEPLRVLGNLLKNVQASLAAWRSNGHVDTTKAFEAIVAVPEYTFVEQRMVIERDAMTSQDKDLLVAGLRNLSKQYPKVLIFAGSIFWREAIDTDEALARYHANLIAAELNLVKFSKTPPTDRATHLRLHGMQNTSGTRTPALQDLVSTKAAPVTCRAYNTVYAFLNGQLAFAPYNKECDFFETGGRSPMEIAYVPGSSGGIREVGGFTFGIEVCRDHYVNTLDGKQADFHIVLSCAVQVKPSQNIGKYLIHASSKADWTGVWDGRNPVTPGKAPAEDDIGLWFLEPPNPIGV